MSLIHLELKNVRNLSQISLDLDADCIIFTGVNGSGKSSLIEGIYLLGRGSSFRSSSLDHVINFNTEELICFGIVSKEEVVKVGLSRNRKSHCTTLRLNGMNTKSLSAVAAKFPIMLITPYTFQLIEGGPRERRRFLDWGLFHVEPSYKNVWQQWQKTLVQRNKLLKSGNIRQLEIDSWNEKYSQLALQVTELRNNYFKTLSNKFFEISPTNKTLLSKGSDFRKDIFEQVELKFHKGWPSNNDLRLLLSESFAADCKTGTTRYGPQRADIQIKAHNVRASEILSRGQIKVLISYLMIAQLRLFKEYFLGNGSPCTVLVDDIGAELDSENQIKLLDEILVEESQVIVTVVDRDQAEKIFFYMNEKYRTRMFHVEHGQINQLR